MRRSLLSYGGQLAAIQAALLLAACGSAPEEKASATNNASLDRPAPKPKDEHVSGPKRLVLAFGDSLYAGYGVPRGLSLPDAIQKRLRTEGIDATLINAGVSGDTTAGGRQRLAYTLDQMERAPDLVLLGLGGNDVLRQIDPKETRANLEAMLAELDRRKIPVVLTGVLSPPNLGPDFAARFNPIWPDLARAHKAVLDPFILQGVIGNRSLMLPDGIHPNAQGIDRIADRLAPVVAGRLGELDAR